MDIEIFVDTDDETLELMTRVPEGKYSLKLIQRDATYKGEGPARADFVYKIVTYEA